MITSVSLWGMSVFPPSIFLPWSVRLPNNVTGVAAMVPRDMTDAVKSMVHRADRRKRCARHPRKTAAL